MRKYINRADKKKADDWLKQFKERTRLRLKIMGEYPKVKEDNPIIIKNYYPEGTDMGVLASSFVIEYKLMNDRKKALKSHTISHEDYLRGDY
tara:strand:- start:22 stop:297 length:276 start_codon:yes stop_codon:yes gene_type:complete